MTDTPKNAKKNIIYETEVIASNKLISNNRKEEDEFSKIFLLGGIFPTETLLQTDMNFGMPLELETVSPVKIVKLAAGVSHCLLLTTSGEVLSYGIGNEGQLGLGNIRIAKNPTKLKLLEQKVNDGFIIDIACGAYHSMALCSNNIVYAWGAGDYLGSNYASATDSGFPQTVEFPGRRKIDVIAAGFGRSMAASKNEVFIWGDTFFGGCCQTPSILYTFSPVEMIQKIAIGWHFAVTLTVAGNIFLWGDATYGELCEGKVVADSDTEENSKKKVEKDSNPHKLRPIKLDLIDGEGTVIPPLRTLEAGARHAMLLSRSGRLWLFGDNHSGQCGAPDYLLRVTRPKRVDVTKEKSRIVSIKCGYSYSAAITGDGSVYLWGNVSYGPLVCSSSQDLLFFQQGLPGLPIRSSLNEKITKPQLIHPLYHRYISNICLGDHFAIATT